MASQFWIPTVVFSISHLEQFDAVNQTLLDATLLTSKKKLLHRIACFGRRCSASSLGRSRDSSQCRTGVEPLRLRFGEATLAGWIEVWSLLETSSLLLAEYQRPQVLMLEMLDSC